MVLWLGVKLVQFLGEGNAIQRFHVYLCELQGCVCTIIAQHEVVLMQLAFRFRTKVEARQLIPGQ